MEGGGGGLFFSRSISMAGQSMLSFPRTYPRSLSSRQHPSRHTNLSTVCRTVLVTVARLVRGADAVLMLVAVLVPVPVSLPQRGGNRNTLQIKRPGTPNQQHLAQ
jgi:hypothetical protein